MIADKRKLFFSFLSVHGSARGISVCMWVFLSMYLCFNG